MRAERDCRESGMQYQFLHPPVQELSDVEHVLGWTRDFVDPAELLQLFSGFAEHAEDLAFEAQFVDTSGISIGRIQHLIRSGGDADGPGRTRRLGERGSGCQELCDIGYRSDSRLHTR